MATEYKLSYTAAQIDEKLGKIDSLSSKIDNLSGISGINEEQITALNNMFKVCAFIKADVSQEYNAFKAAFGISNSGDDVEPEEPHTHSYTSAVTKEATCTTDGVRTYTCSCNETYTEVIPATGHTYVDGVCTVCGAADPNYEPDVPEVTLSSISATYSGGSVPVGTAVNSLSSIVVTAHYSDGSTETVTSYILSGTIGEGDNTVTVSYEGKTTTFTVTGVAESGGDDNEEEPHTHSYTSAVTKEATCTTDGVRTYTCSCNETYTEVLPATGHTYVDGVCTSCGAADPNADDGTGWTANEAYTDYNWTDGVFVMGQNGNAYSGGDYSTTDYMPCAGVTTLMSSQKIDYGAFYDRNKTYIGTCYPKANERLNVPENAAFFRISGKTATVKSISIIPDYVFEVEGTWTDGVAYADLGWTNDYFINDNNGNPQAYNGLSMTDYLTCNGASTIDFTRAGSSQNMQYTAFYDVEKARISRFSLAANKTTTITVPENAVYFRVSEYTDYIDNVVIVPHA